MTLEEGVTLIQSSINNIAGFPIQQWNNLSMLDMLEFGIFASIVFWFSARMINKNANELAVQHEFNQSMENGDWGANPEYAKDINYSDAYRDDDEGTQTTLERSGGW